MGYIFELGYCLTGETSEKIAMCFEGEHDNGKSTLISIISQVMNSSTTPLCATEELYKLKDSRLVIFNEVENIDINESFFKTITSGGLDVIEAQKKYCSPIDFIPKFKIIIVSNSIPHLSASNATLSRIRVLHFKAKFTDREELIDLKDYRNEIFYWLVEGAHQYYKYGLNLVSDNLINATKKFRNECDSFNLFINECCCCGQNLEMPAQRFYEEYVEFCHINGYKLLKQQSFSQKLMNSGFERIKNSSYYYKGIITTSELMLLTIPSPKYLLQF